MALGALVLVPVLVFLLGFGRWVVLGAMIFMFAAYFIVLKKHFGPLILPWKVQLAQLQPAQNSSWVSVSGQLFFRVVAAMVAGLLFTTTFGNLGMFLTVPLLIWASGMLCIEIYEFIKQV